jgi:hypothetical protein
MDCATGRIYPASEATEPSGSLKQNFIEIKIPLTQKQRDTGKIGRNDPCPCGSGLKAKRCHLRGKMSRRIV